MQASTQESNSNDPAFSSHDLKHASLTQQIMSRLRGRRLLARTKHPDQLERVLIPLSQNNSNAKWILRCYRRMCRSDGQHLKNLIWLATSNGTMLTFRYGGNYQETISECFDKIETELSRNSFPGLRICAVTHSATQIWHAYGHVSQVYLTLVSRRQAAMAITRVLLAYLLSVHWANGMEDRAMIHRALLGRKHDHELWRVKLPSSSKSLNVLSLPGEQTLELPSTMEWRWMREMPIFENDLDIYLAQPFAARPSLDYLQVLILQKKRSEEREVLLVTSSQDVLGRVVSTFKTDLLEISMECGTDTHFYRLCAIILTVIRADLTVYLDAAVARVDVVGLKGRGRPSGWKVKYLLHLQELHRTLAVQCRKTMATIRIVRGSIQMPLPVADSRIYDVLFLLNEINVDLEYLADSLEAKAEEITPIKDMIKEQMELGQSFWSTVLGFLVALYVPLSFASSFFGMNLRDSQETFYWTNTTMNGTHTETLTSSDQPGTRNWAQWEFWAMAIPLSILSIIVPLIGGPLYRSVAKFARRNKVWWKVFVAFSGLAIAFFIQHEQFTYGYIIGILLWAWHVAIARLLKRKSQLDPLMDRWWFGFLCLVLVTNIPAIWLADVGDIMYLGLVAFWFFRPEYFYSPSQARKLWKQKDVIWENGFYTKRSGPDTSAGSDANRG